MTSPGGVEVGNTFVSVGAQIDASSFNAAGAAAGRAFAASLASTTSGVGDDLQRQLNQVNGTSAFSGLAASARSGMSQVSDSIKSSSKEFSDFASKVSGPSVFAVLGGTAVAAGTAIVGAMASASRAVSSLGDQVRSVAGQMEQVGQSMTTYVTAPAVGILALASKTGIETAINLENARASLASLLPVGTNVEALMQRLSDFAVKSPIFGVDQVVQFTRNLVGAGVELTKSEQIVHALNDIFATFAVTGDKADMAMLGVSQAFSKGKLQAEELTGQIGEQLPMLSLLAQAAGVTQAQFLKMVTAGDITSATFADLLIKVQALPQIMAGASKGAETLSAQFNILKESMQQNLAQGFLANFDGPNGIKAALVSIQPFLDAFISWFTNKIPVAIAALKNIAQAVSDMSDSWNKLTPDQRVNIEHLLEAFVLAGPTFLALSKTLTIIGAALQTIALLGNPVTLAFAGVGSVLALLGVALVDLYKKSQDFRDGVKAFTDEISLGWESKIKPAFVGIGDEITSKLLPAVQALMKEIAVTLGFDNWKEFGAWLGTAFVAVLQGVASGLTHVVDGLAFVTSKIKDLMDEWDRLTPEKQQQIEHLLEAFVIAGPAFLALSKTLGLIQGSLTAISLLANPITLAFAATAIAIGALVVKFKDAYDTSAAFRKQVDDFITAVDEGWKNKVIPALQNFKKEVEDGIEAFKKGWDEKIFPALESFRDTVVNKLIPAFRDLMKSIFGDDLTGKGVGDALAVTVADIVKGLDKIASTLATITNIATNVNDAFGKVNLGALDTLRNLDSINGKLQDYYNKQNTQPGGQGTGAGQLQTLPLPPDQSYWDKWAQNIKDAFDLHILVEWGKGLGKVLEQTGNWLQDMIKKAGSWVEDVFGPSLVPGWKYVSDFTSQSWTDIGTIWDKGTAALKQKWDTYSATFILASKSTWGFVSSNAADAWKGLETGWDSTLAFLKRAWDAFSLVFTTSIKTTLDFIGNLFTTAWHGIAGTWNNLWDGLWTKLTGITSSLTGGITNMLGSIKAAFESFSTSLGTVWAGMWNGLWSKLMTTKDALIGGVSQLRDGFAAVFASLVNGVASTMGRIQGAAAEPVNWVIDMVYNLGLKKLVDTVSSAIGLNLTMPTVNRIGAGSMVTINKMAPAGFASGGLLQGPGTGTSDSMLIRASHNEYIVNAASTRKHLGLIEAINRDQVPGFAVGGLVGDALSGITNAGNWIAGNASKFVAGSTMKVLAPLVDSMKHSLSAFADPGNVFAKMAGHAASRLLDGIVGKIQAKDSAVGSGGSLGTGGQSVNRIISIMQKSGLPYRVTSSYRDTNDYHGQGKAVDFASSHTGMAQIARFWMKYSSALLELIHGDSYSFVKNGKVVGADFYGAATVAQHASWGNNEHVHVAMNNDAVLPGEGGQGGAATVGGQLGQWIAKAMQITGVPGNWANGIQTIIMRESGGNPRAINNWDSNAMMGDPSRGLMQTIGSTFRSYRDQTLVNDIYDPVANIVAGINYIRSRYGTIFNVQQANPNLPPRGYDNGGPLAPINHSGKVENVLNYAQGKAFEKRIAGDGHEKTLNLTLDLGEGIQQAYTVKMQRDKQTTIRSLKSSRRGG